MGGIWASRTAWFLLVSTPSAYFPSSLSLSRGWRTYGSLSRILEVLIAVEVPRTSSAGFLVRFHCGIWCSDGLLGEGGGRLLGTLDVVAKEGVCFLRGMTLWECGVDEVLVSFFVLPVEEIFTRCVQLDSLSSALMYISLFHLSSFENSSQSIFLVYQHGGVKCPTIECSIWMCRPDFGLL